MNRTRECVSIPSWRLLGRVRECPSKRSRKRQKRKKKWMPFYFIFFLKFWDFLLRAAVSIHLLCGVWAQGAAGRGRDALRCGGAAASCQPRLCPATRPRSICRSRNEASRPLAQASPRSPIHPHPPFSVLLFFLNGLTIALPVAFTAAVRPTGESLNLLLQIKGTPLNK